MLDETNILKVVLTEEEGGTTHVTMQGESEEIVAIMGASIVLAMQTSGIWPKVMELVESRKLSGAPSKVLRTSPAADLTALRAAMGKKGGPLTS